MEETKETYTKEEVENIVKNINIQARKQCESYYNEIINLKNKLAYRRLDYLFKVLDNEINFSTEFISKCIEEIEFMLTPPKEENNEEVNNEEA